MPIVSPQPLNQPCWESSRELIYELQRYRDARNRHLVSDRLGYSHLASSSLGSCQIFVQSLWFPLTGSLKYWCVIYPGLALCLLLIALIGQLSAPVHWESYLVCYILPPQEIYLCFCDVIFCFLRKYKKELCCTRITLRFFIKSVPGSCVANLS